MRSVTKTDQRALQAAQSVLTIASFGLICASSSGPVRQIAGLCLISTLAFAVWSPRRWRFDAIVPAVGLTLAFLVLAGLALAAVHALTTVPAALMLAGATLTAVWAGGLHRGPEAAHPRARLKPPNPLVLGGLLAFAVATVLAVHYSALSAEADADGATSVAIWAFPSGDQLHVGLRQPTGHGAATLRIIVTQAGATIAAWNDIRLAPGQTWEAPALTVPAAVPAQVVALHGGTVVASLSAGGGNP